MPLDPRTYRSLVGQFATGVTVIATEAAGQVHAMTANSFTSLSLEPVLVLFAVDKRARLAALRDHLTGFTVNILRADQQALSTYFAGGWKQPTPPPFRFVPWEGGPRLEGCLAALGCTRHGIIEGGDHWIFIGEVTALHQGVAPHHPLLYNGGRYRHLSQESAPAPELEAGAPPQMFYDPWHPG